ncbi:MAG: type transport system ATP-binding protein [Actinomycetota bacterium]|nr:type transport system ATP-binding protein [Actinomycetota bacterium]
MVAATPGSTSAVSAVATTGHAIVAEGLIKHYGDVHALDGFDLEVAEGTVVSLLGPNGAGKTTAVRIFTTLLAPDRGRATVAGLDVVRDADAVRRLIGVSGQNAAVDEYLTGRENLDMIGRLYHLGKAKSRARADELLELFDLVDAANRVVKTYSGGMRRRLDLAGSLVAKPRVLFLDEPTTGLDPRSRLGMWDVLEELVGEGTTLLLTTQYLEEADRLANLIVVIDHGKVIARGTADELKSQIGGERLELTVSSPAELPATVEVLRKVGIGDPKVDENTRSAGVAVEGGSVVLIEALRQLDAAGVVVKDVGIRRPTLDDVFLALTGHGAEETPDVEPDGGTKRGRRGGRAPKGEQA